MLPVRDHLPTRSVAGVNYTLIAANTLVMLGEMSRAASGADVEALAARWALVPAQLTAHPLASLPSLFTHMFLHGSLAHLAGNMLFLWIFGDNVEDALGHGRYLLFYLTCGVAAALAQVALGPHASVPMLGASGAISGVLAGYLFLYPTSPIEVINPIPILWLFWGLFIWIPAWFVIIEWFGANLYSALTSNTGAGGVAFAAHVGGFIAGLASIPLLRTKEAVDYAPWDRFLDPRYMKSRRGRHAA